MEKRTPESGVRPKASRLCVYTTLVGRYEHLNEQPQAAHSGIPFICLTDDPDLKSDSWDIRRVPPLFGMDLIRSQRDLKIRPHVYLTEFDASIYVDNSVLLTQPPECLFERLFPASGFCLPEHSFRDSTLDEFLEVARLGLDEPSRIFEQLNHYMIDFPEVLKDKPYWTAILLRDHRNPNVKAMLEIWAAHVLRYSRRDQLSVNAAFRHAGLPPDVLKIDNNVSWFHTWPHVEGRDCERRVHQPGTSMMPVVARIRQMEQRLNELRKQEQLLDEEVRRQEQHLISNSQRVARALRRYAHGRPRVARFCRAGLRAVTRFSRLIKMNGRRDRGD